MNLSALKQTLEANQPGLEDLKEFIQANWRPTRKINYSRTAMGLCSLAEKQLNRDVSEAQLIEALHLAGFQSVAIGDRTFFNIKDKK